MNTSVGQTVSGALVGDLAAAGRRALADELAGPAVRSIRFSKFIAASLLILVALVAVFVPISSGSLAVGQIAVDGERKMVQHASGGIISEILVTEGEVVEAGDIVLRLDPVQAGAAAGVLDVRVDSLWAEEAVRLAELTGKAKIDFPDQLLNRRGEPSIDALLTAEQASFDSRAALARSQTQQLKEQLAQLDQSVIGAGAQIDAQQAQATLFEAELASLRPLLEKGLVTKARILALERSLEGARGQVAALGAEQKRLTAKIAETRSLLARVNVDRRAQAAEALRAVRAELAEVLERRLGTADTLQRTEVKAPIGGTVMALRVSTVGGVVEPGQALLEIVPQSSELVVSVRIPPRDADDVRPGMPAIVRLDAGGPRSPPRINGTVQSISADALNDERTGAPFFEVRVAIPEEDVANVPADLIAPGLPAEVLIQTGSHTMVDYLFSPVERAMFRSMRDS